VTGPRFDRIQTRLAAAKVAHPGTKPLCVVGAEITGVSGAGIMLMSGEIPRGSFCSSNPVSNLIEELQFTLGEGPCVDAYQQDRPVLEPDLLGPEAMRWPAFTPSAVEAGVRAIFGFPLRVGAIRLGALNLYRDRPGPLGDDEHADALVMAEVAALSILEVQADAPAGRLRDDLLVGANLQFGVHQAAGMVSVQLGVTITEALVRLRAYSFGHGRPLSDVAADVVHRRLDFR